MCAALFKAAHFFSERRAEDSKLGKKRKRRGEYIMKKIISITLVLLLVLSLVAAAYDDIDSSPYKEEIYDLTSYAILEGNDGSFRPEDSLTRAEAARMLLRTSNVNDEMAKSFSENMTEIKFSDIDANHWAYSYIYGAAVYGMMNGFPDATARPEDNVTAIQFITMAVRLVGYEEYAKEAGGYPDGYIKVSKDIGIIDNMELNYEENITREQAAKVIHSLIKVPLNVVSGFEVIRKENEDGTFTEEAATVTVIADGRDNGEILTLFGKIYDNNKLKE